MQVNATANPTATATATADALAQSLTIRAANAAEARACRILLPEMYSADQTPGALVAIIDDGGKRLAGAVAMGTVNMPGAHGFPVLAHVVPEYRRRGVGRALLNAAVARARGRTPALASVTLVGEASQAARFCMACGFDRFDEIRHFETDTRAFHTDMARRHGKLAARGLIPAAAHIVSLRDAPIAAVAAMITAHFPSPLARTLARLQPGASDGYDIDNSVALLVGERLAGVLVYQWRGALPVIEVRIVERAFRGGWANVLLLEAATRNGLLAGSEQFAFFAQTDITDTMRLAQRAGAELVRVERRFWRVAG